MPQGELPADCISSWIKSVEFLALRRLHCGADDLTASQCHQPLRADRIPVFGDQASLDAEQVELREIHRLPSRVRSEPANVNVDEVPLSNNVEYFQVDCCRRLRKPRAKEVLEACKATRYAGIVLDVVRAEILRGGLDRSCAQHVAKEVLN